MLIPSLIFKKLIYYCYDDCVFGYLFGCYMSNKIPSFVIVGQVDSGKSSTCGHLLYLTKYINDHEMNKIKIECDKDKMARAIFARLLDIYDEEKIKGKTHEYQLIEFNYNGKPYELIDTPGHKSFIRSMITGLFQKKSSELIGCLIVSALKGEFEAGFGNGQTREDIVLLRAIGISRVIVLVNKMDTVGWDRGVYDDLVGRLDKFIRRLKFKKVVYLPLSAFYGTGLISVEGLPSWYTGKSFIDTLSDLNDMSVAEIDSSSEEKNDMLFKTSEIMVQFNILNSQLITVGYSGMCHYSGGEINYIISRILTINDKNFIPLKNCIAKTEDKMMAILNLDYEILISKNSKLLFRDREQTVGFGKILKIKPSSK